jgi:transglutaminase-like putative cysteine protease
MAYDDVQIEDDSTCYQDGAKCLIRRQIAICEGFANVFVALCRAQGIPAAVQFGIGCSTYESLIDVDELDSTDSDHAWAAVCIEGEWYYLDPTFDIGAYYEGDAWDD